MTIYIDENLSPLLAKGFHLLQRPLTENWENPVIVKSIIEEFGTGVQDEDWISHVGLQGSCVITQDYNLQRIRHQRILSEQAQLGMFYFRPPTKKGFRYWDMVRIMVKHWPEILKIIEHEDRPFSYQMTSRKGPFKI